VRERNTTERRCGGPAVGSNSPAALCERGYEGAREQWNMRILG
jgi:hypothetical protein